MIPVLSLLASVFNGGGLSAGLRGASVIARGRMRAGSLADAIIAIVNFSLGFVALIAVIAFIVSGFIFILGFGSDSAIQRAKKIMIWSAIGVVVILSSYSITDFIISFATAG